MKTSSIVIILVVVVLGIMGFITFQAFKTERNFVVYHSQAGNFCLMVDDFYQVENTATEFRYRGGKNSGVMTIKQQDGFSEGMTAAPNNGFNAAYRKLKNTRIFEYQLGPGLYLHDEFLFAKKAPVNLVPYRDDCEKIMKKFKQHQVIFSEVL